MCNVSFSFDHITCRLQHHSFGDLDDDTAPEQREE
jgi:hypothetical protein